MDAGAVPLLPPAERARGQVAVISQSGGMGFAFFDHGRPKDLSFRYIVTTGNEACLEACDFVDFMLDEGKTDVFLLLIEDIKNPATFARVAAKALRAGKPLIVNRLGASEAGARAIAAHTAAQGDDAEYRALFAKYGVIESNDLDEMLDIAAAFITMGDRLPAGKPRRDLRRPRAAAARGWRMPARSQASTCRCSTTRRAPRSTCTCRPTAARRTRSTSPRRRSTSAATRSSRGSPASRPMSTASFSWSPAAIRASSWRTATTCSRSAATARKPVLLWSYTRPAAVCVDLLSEAGLPLFTNVHNCARAMRVMADYRAARASSLKG